MNTNKKIKRILALCVAVAVAPGMLLSGIGTAHAAPGKGIDVIWSQAMPGAGLTVTVKNLTKKAGKCTYDAVPVNLPLPAYHHDFDLGPGSSVAWFIPVIATGTTWSTTVRCGDPNNFAAQTGFFQQTSSF